MLAFLGDIHTNVTRLEKAAQIARAAGAVALIQVGDLGIYQSTWPKFAQADLAVPTYAIDGNHEMHAYWFNPTVRNELLPRLRLLDRGDVFVLDGRLIGFLGGARSVDEAYQRRKGTWSPRECTTPADLDRLLENARAFDRPIDILVTHTPPQWMVDQHFDPRNLQWYFGLSKDWKDPSAALVEEAWRKLGEPTLICGHMHRSVTDGKVRILAEDELVML